jgi:hypothetical protein
MKLCKDCVHYKRRTAPAPPPYDFCGNSDVQSQMRPALFAVRGFAPVPCELARDEQGACGPDARYYESVARRLAVIARFMRRYFPR